MLSLFAARFWLIMIIGACKAAMQDKTRFSKMKGYGSKSLIKYTLRITQVIKNRENPIIKPQLPACSVSLSASISPNFSLSLSSLSTSIAMGLSISKSISCYSSSISKFLFNSIFTISFFVFLFSILSPIFIILLICFGVKKKLFFMIVYRL